MSDPFGEGHADRVSRLLVFVQDPELRGCLRELLAVEGHEVSAPALPVDALGGLRDPSVQTVLVDLDDGEPAAELVRSARRARPELRIVALSGDGGKVSPNEVRLAHPCRADELLAAVDRAVPQRC